ncbi:MAG: Gfo/Idh/MocA family oxidoreductase [Rhodospirillaceae bacterium]|nr:Gfo/Idh/MocA family oxidoreductase [Rhodospirillaceae bacterium]
MTADPLRFGLIGAGRWGRIFIETLQRFDAAKLVRLASTNPDSRALVGDDCVLSKDWQDVAGASDIDGVIIATPPAVHAEMAHAAIAAGNPVLVEKPLTLDVKEARALLDFAESKGAIVHVDHVHLYHPAYRALKKEGLGLGPLHAIRSGAGNRGPYRPDASVLWDWGPHDVAMCLDLMGGKPTSVSARLCERRKVEGGEGESIALQLTFAGGLKADIELSNILEKKKRFLVAHYDHESLIYDDCAQDILVREPRPDDAKCLPEAATVIDVPGTQALDQVLTDFTEAIMKAETDLTGLRLGLNVVEVLDDCEKALKT